MCLLEYLFLVLLYFGGEELVAAVQILYTNIPINILQTKLLIKKL